jgi:hypothetical protein
MSIFDLLFIATVLGTIGVFFAAVGAIFRRRWTFVRRSLGGLLVLWGIYLVVGTAIAIMTPQRIQPIGANRCFDEMCFAVSRFRRVPRIERGRHVAQAHGVFYIVDVRVSSKSRGRAQHEAGRKGILIDELGRIYDVSVEGTQALAATEGPSPGLDTDLSPGETALAKLIFDLPSEVKRPGFALESSLVFYPPRIIIGDEMHFLHKPTITLLE